MADIPKETKPLIRFWNGWLKAEMPALAFAMLMMIIIALATSAYTPMLAGMIKSLSILSEHPNRIIIWNINASHFAYNGPFIIIIISLIHAIGIYLSTVATNRVALNATTNLQNDFFAKLLTLDYSRISKEQSGAFSSRFLNDINSIREAILKVANSMVRDLLIVIGVIGVMLWLDWQLTIVTLVILPIAIIPINNIGTKLRKAANRAQSQAGQLSGVIEESLGGIRLVKTYNLEKKEALRVADSLIERRRLLFKTIEQRGRIEPILQLLGGFAIAGVFAFASYRIIDGQSDVGTLAGFISGLLQLSTSVRSLGNMNSVLQEGIAGLLRFYEVFDENPQILNSKNPIALKNVKGQIIFENVDFEIDGTQILKNINFTADVGKTIAFVGLSGAGKSSIINLVPRLFDVTNGRILIDNIDIKNIDINELRGAISLVSQDAILFETTIAKNICFGIENKTEEDIINALKLASCDFVFELENSIHTMVEPRGGNFSGGQKQRLALARAILRDAPVLLLDEPTSALDSETEAKIAISLEKFCENRTTLVVAHRISTISKADKIIVMANGEIIESGTHNELMEKNGQFAELARLQTK